MSIIYIVIIQMVGSNPRVPCKSGKFTVPWNYFKTIYYFVFACICTHKCGYTYMCACLFECVCVCLFECVCVYVCVCVWMGARVYAYMRACFKIHIERHRHRTSPTLNLLWYLYLYKSKYLHILIHMCIYLYMCLGYSSTCGIQVIST